MSFFEYISILTSIIVGLGLTQLLSGVGRLMSDPQAVKPYWVHLVWVANQFLMAIFLWWYEFRLAEREQWTFEAYSFVTVYFTVFYLQCVLLFPRQIDRYQSFRDYYYDRRHWIFGLFLFGSVIDFGDTLIKGVDHFLWLGPEYVARQVAFVALYVLAARSSNERFHAIFALAAVVYNVVWVLRYYPSFG